MYRVAQKVVHFQHHIFGTVQDKMKHISPKFSYSVLKQRLGCSFYVNVKYSLKISFTFIVPQNTVTNSSASDFFAIARLNIRHSFSAVIRNNTCKNILKHFSPRINYVVRLPC